MTVTVARSQSRWAWTRSIALLVVVTLATASCADDSVDDGQPTAPITTSSTTSDSTDSTTSSVSSVSSVSSEVGSTETFAPPAALTLIGDGLGVVPFGEPVDSALPLLVEALGEPSSDSTVRGAMPDGLGGDDTTVRLVEFGQLSVTFTDWPYFRDDGVLHLVRWILFDFDGTGTSDLSTPEGITLGSTVDDLRTAFGDGLLLPSTPDECTGGWYFVVGELPRGLRGTLDGPTTDGSSSVVFLTAGAQSSC